jgi:acyl-CoA synthetase (AMP-forming)/AMP-acid ligase II
MFSSSSDQALMRENGYCEIVGRIKDMVIRGGENIYPFEIEEVLQTNSDILEAYAFGIPDLRMGEELGVWIKANPSKDTMTEEDVRNFLKPKVTSSI